MTVPGGPTTSGRDPSSSRRRTAVFRFGVLSDVPRDGAHTTLLTCCDDLDFGSRTFARGFLQSIVLDDTAGLVVDVSAVFVGAAAVGVLGELGQRCARHGTFFAVVGLPAWFVATLCRLDVPTIDCYPTVTHAVRAACAADEPEGWPPRTVRRSRS